MPNDRDDSTNFLSRTRSSSGRRTNPTKGIRGRLKSWDNRTDGRTQEEQKNDSEGSSSYVKIEPEHYKELYEILTSNKDHKFGSNSDAISKLNIVSILEKRDKQKKDSPNTSPSKEDYFITFRHYYKGQKPSEKELIEIADPDKKIRTELAQQKEQLQDPADTKKTSTSLSNSGSTADPASRTISPAPSTPEDTTPDPEKQGNPNSHKKTKTKKYKISTKEGDELYESLVKTSRAKIPELIERSAEPFNLRIKKNSFKHDKTQKTIEFELTKHRHTTKKDFKEFNESNIKTNLTEELKKIKTITLNHKDKRDIRKKIKKAFKDFGIDFNKFKSDPQLKEKSKEFKHRNLIRNSHLVDDVHRNKNKETVITLKEEFKDLDKDSFKDKLTETTIKHRPKPAPETTKNAHTHKKHRIRHHGERNNGHSRS